MTIRRPASRPPRRRVLRLVGLLMVTAGLIGMHGLGSHDAAGMESVPQPVMSEMSMSSSLSDLNEVVNRGADGAGLDLGPVHGPAEVLGAWSPIGMDMSMAMMCLAVLAVGLIALLRLLLGRRTPPVLTLTGRHSVTSLPHGRAPDPPSLIALSIQRC